MQAQEAFRRGFRIAWSQRKVLALEIVWRWSFWLAAGALVVGTTALWLHSLPLSPAELRNLRAGPPWLVGLTLVHILSTASANAKAAFFFCMMGTFLLWWIFGSAFRARMATWILGHMARAGRRLKPADFGVMLSYHAAWFLVSGLCFLIAARILGRVAFPARGALLHDKLSFASGIVGIAAMLLFWQMFSWMLSLGRSYALGEQTDLLAGLGLATSRLGESLVDVLAFTTTFFLLRSAVFLVGALVVLLVCFLPDWDRGTSVMLALPLAAVFVSLPCRFLATAQSAGFLALTRRELVPARTTAGALRP